jgi:hypothetical protein
VLVDENDKVVGGGLALLDADLPSGSTAAFDATKGVMDTAYDKAARAKCSVESVLGTGE